MRKCYQWKLMSKIRKRYFIRLAGRCLTFLIGVGMLIFTPEEFDILEGGNFFRRFSVLHILWGVWVCDMIEQLVPVKRQVPLGSQKLFAMRFKPILEKVNAQALKQYDRTIALHEQRDVACACARDGQHVHQRGQQQNARERAAYAAFKHGTEYAPEAPRLLPVLGEEAEDKVQRGEDGASQHEIVVDQRVESAQ